PHKESASIVWDVDKAKFVGPDHFLTKAVVAPAILWRLSDLKPIVEFSDRGRDLPEASPTGRYLAAPVDDGIAILETASGKVCGHLKAPRGADGIEATAFRNDGRRLAATDGKRLLIWNLE